MLDSVQILDHSDDLCSPRLHCSVFSHSEKNFLEKQLKGEEFILLCSSRDFGVWSLGLVTLGLR